MGTIRKAGISDAGVIARIFRDSRETAMPWLPVLHSKDADLRFFQTKILPNLEVLVHETQGQVDGFISLSTDWIDQLYIAPHAQGTGIGTRLLQRGLTDVNFRQLWVFKQNLAAQSFYQKHGFVKVEETDGRNNEERCPDYRMEWHAG